MQMNQHASFALPLHYPNYRVGRGTIEILVVNKKKLSACIRDDNHR